MVDRPLFQVPAWDVSTIELNWSTRKETKILDRCVYCNSEKGLTDEHTFPFSIWGKRELVKGSCTACQRKIQPIEQYLCRDLLGNVREYLSFPTRQKGKGKRKRARTGFQPMWDWETDEKIDVPFRLALQMIILPNRNHFPRKLTEEMFLPLHQCTDWAFIPLQNNVHHDVINRLSTKITLKPNLVERVIAKIAYCEYIFQYDVGYYNEEISRFITDGDAHDFVVSQYVGSCSTEQSLNRLHSIKFFCTPAPNGHFNLVAQLALFHFWKAPTFLVWLGVMNQLVDGIPFLQSPPKGPAKL